ncbi:hypothetical protein M0R72_13715 [Candidatus Pacearchaeota archaeon]|jgi:hypothetical protein|nr:hypothetical protein [Candidatus Pacearchaeota archaeon]
MSETETGKLHTRIDALDNKICGKLDGFTSALAGLATRLTIVETRQNICIAEHDANEHARRGALWSGISRIVVTVIVSVATAAVAYALMQGKP